MKILYHHRTVSRDGQAVHIAEMTSALARLGCEVIVVGPPQSSDGRFGERFKHIDSVRVRFPKFVAELIELSYGFLAYVRLKHALIRHNPDVLYERHGLYLMAGAWLKRRYGIPYLLEVNSPLQLERQAHGGLALPALARRLETAVWRAADAVLPVSRVLADMIAGQGVPRERLQVIPNGVNPELFAAPPDPAEAKSRLGLGGKLVLGFTGFVRDWHGLDQVIDFLAAVKRDDLVLLIVGNGPARSNLEAQAKRLGVQAQVRFTGVVEHGDIPKVLMAFDIALQPASTSYASPLKLFEYLALGRAIVAPDQPNFTEILSHGENAMLFRPGDRASLHDVLQQLVEDHNLRERLGRAARQTIQQRELTWDRNAERVVAEARRLLAGKSVATQAVPIIKR